MEASCSLVKGTRISTQLSCSASPNWRWAKAAVALPSRPWSDSTPRRSPSAGGQLGGPGRPHRGLWRTDYPPGGDQQREGDGRERPSQPAQQLLAAEIKRQGQAVITTVGMGQPAAKAVLLHEERSIGMHGLLSLANTESHNSTAEVLLRQATGSWDQPTSQLRTQRWLAAQGL